MNHDNEHPGGTHDMKTDKMNSGGLSRRLLMSLGILGVAGAVAGLGTWAQFTDSTSANHSISTGTVDVELGSSGTINRFTQDATDVAAGDTITRAVDLNLDGSLDLSNVSLTVAGGVAGLNDSTNGLNLKVEECSTAWPETGTNPYTYGACTGTRQDVLADGDILQSNSTLSLSSLSHGTRHLLFTWTLPSGAAQPAQGGLTGAYTYTFAAAQRAGTNR